MSEIYFDFTDDFEPPPNYCHVDEWHKDCFYNDTGSLEYCSEICELDRKFRCLAFKNPNNGKHTQSV